MDGWELGKIHSREKNNSRGKKASYLWKKEIPPGEDDPEEHVYVDVRVGAYSQSSPP
jgi:hypothetical protein